MTLCPRVQFFLANPLVAILLANTRKSEVESKTHGSRPRPGTQKKSEAKDSPSEDRPSRGQGQKCSRQRPIKGTGASVLKNKKKVFKIFLTRSPKKKRKKRNGLQKFFSGDLQNFNNSKTTALLKTRTGQFFFEDWRLRGQGHRTSKCVLEDSTSGRPILRVT